VQFKPKYGSRKCMWFCWVKQSELNTPKFGPRPLLKTSGERDGQFCTVRYIGKQRRQ